MQQSCVHICHNHFEYYSYCVPLSPPLQIQLQVPAHALHTTVSCMVMKQQHLQSYTELQVSAAAIAAYCIPQVNYCSNGDGTSHMDACKRLLTTSSSETGFLNKQCTAVLGHICAGSGTACSTGTVAHEWCENLQLAARVQLHMSDVRTCSCMLLIVNYDLSAQLHA